MPLRTSRLAHEYVVTGVRQLINQCRLVNIEIVSLYDFLKGLYARRQPLQCIGHTGLDINGFTISLTKLLKIINTAKAYRRIFLSHNNDSSRWQMMVIPGREICNLFVSFHGKYRKINTMIISLLLLHIKGLPSRQALYLLN
jgi:hypothetical protein